MKFHAVLLYINDQFPDISIFKNLQEVGRGLYPKGAYLYSVEQEFITDRFYWMYFQYDNAKLYSDKVIDIEDNSVKENPRPKSQVEPRLQLFSCYDLESHILYVSDYSKKATITDSLSLPKAGTHSPAPAKSHTAAHTAKQGGDWRGYPACAVRLEREKLFL